MTQIIIIFTADVERRIAGALNRHDLTSGRNFGAFFPVAIDLASIADAVMARVFPRHLKVVKSPRQPSIVVPKEKKNFFLT